MNSTQNRSNTSNENRNGVQGGSHEQHVEAGRQSHKNDHAKQDDPHSRLGKSASASDTSKSSGKGVQGGTHEQHVEAGRQSHKNDANKKH